MPFPLLGTLEVLATLIKCYAFDGFSFCLEFHLPFLTKLTHGCYLGAISGSFLLPVICSCFLILQGRLLVNPHSCFFAFWQFVPITFSKLYSECNKQRM